MTTPSPTRRVLVLGANGRFGLAAVQAFAAAGWDVLAQVRRAPAAAMPANVRCIAVPVTDVDAIVALAAGAQVVVHALNPHYTRWSAEVMPLGRLGMEIAERLGARFALPGNVYNYGAAMPPLLAADTPQWASTRKGRLRVELEAEMRRRAPRLRSVILRAGDYFGSGEGNWFDLQIAKGAARGRLSYPGATGLAHAWAYVPDMARALVGLCEHAALPDFADIPFAGNTLTGSALMDAIERAARELGAGGARPFRRAEVPWWLMRLLSPVAPLLRELVEMRYLWDTPHALDDAALRRWLPAFAPTPLPEAMRASVQALLPASPKAAPAAA